MLATYSAQWTQNETTLLTVLTFVISCSIDLTRVSSDVQAAGCVYFVALLSVDRDPEEQYTYWQTAMYRLWYQEKHAQSEFLY